MRRLRPSRARRRVALAAVLVIVSLAGISAWALWSVARELEAAKSAITLAPGDPRRDGIEAAQGHVSRAEEQLGTLGIRAARFVPVTRQNIDAIAGITDALPAVLETGERLISEIESIRGRYLVEGAKIRAEVLRGLQDPLADQIAALEGLQTELHQQLSGWLLPPLWNEFEDLSSRVKDLREDASAAADALALLDPILGAESQRTYLVVLMNNAELRGAGGLPSSVGTLSIEDGRVRLGRFHYVGDLKDGPPYRRVTAPADFRRRWGRYGADTTLWSNLTMSPDVPDVARVGARLFRLETGRTTDGVFLADPRGIAALMADSASVRVPGTGRVLTRDEIPDYIYRDSYAELGGFSSRRRRAILTLGERAFRTVFRQGFQSSREELGRIGRAVSGGHIRFVPFSSGERAVLGAIGLTGDLSGTEGDSVLVTAQATAAHKLDYYVSRSVDHDCELSSDAASCKTTVTLTNRVPAGLSRFVAPERPYGVVKSFVEIYVPAAAQLTAVEMNEERARFLRGEQDGHTAVGFDIELQRDRSVTVSAAYELDIDDRYALEIGPQPLCRDASLEVTLDVPADWDVWGPGTIRGGELRLAGTFDRTFRIEARAKDRSGLAAMWEGLARFWNEPLF